MIEDLEADLTGAPIYASNDEYADLAEVKNYDEYITVVSAVSNEMEIGLKE